LFQLSHSWRVGSVQQR